MFDSMFFSSLFCHFFELKTAGQSTRFEFPAVRKINHKTEMTQTLSLAPVTAPATGVKLQLSIALLIFY